MDINDLVWPQIEKCIVLVEPGFSQKKGFFVSLYELALFMEPDIK